MNRLLLVKQMVRLEGKARRADSVLALSQLEHLLYFVSVMRTVAVKQANSENRAKTEGGYTLALEQKQSGI